MSFFSSKMRNHVPARARSRRWVWYFVILALLTGAAIAIEIWYNPTTPLTAPLLAQAEAKWKEHGPRDYDMDYVIKKLDSTERFQVKVRKSQAVSVIMNGNALESRLYPFSTMPALFGFIEEFLQQDSEPGHPRTFTSVLFDSVDGHLIHYVRSVASKRERVEITVRLTPVPATAPTNTMPGEPGAPATGGPEPSSGR